MMTRNSLSRKPIITNASINAGLTLVTASTYDESSHHAWCTRAAYLGTASMRIAYLDCFSGISGDMFLGALVDAGVSAKLLEEAVAALDIGARIELSRVVRNGIAALKVDVYSHGEKDLPRAVFHEHGGSHNHHAAHKHHEHSRGLGEIRTIIEKASISDAAKATANRVFEALGAAEAEIHN